MRKFLVVFVLLAAAGAGAWYLFYRPSPRYAVGRLGAAVATRDTAAIYRYADLAGISQSFAREVEEEATGDGRTARLLEGILRGGSDRTNPYLISLAEQLVWTALMRADSGPAIAGHVVGARSVTSSRVAGDSAWAVVPMPVRVPEVRIDTTIAARLVFERRDGEWVLVEVRDVARPLLRAGLEAYLREQRSQAR